MRRGGRVRRLLRCRDASLWRETCSRTAVVPRTVRGVWRRHCRAPFLQACRWIAWKAKVGRGRKQQAHHLVWRRRRSLRAGSHSATSQRCDGPRQQTPAQRGASPILPPLRRRPLPYNVTRHRIRNAAAPPPPLLPPPPPRKLRFGGERCWRQRTFWRRLTATSAPLR